MTNKPILCLDFDGVIHSYISGWKGADQIPDNPVLGAMGFLQEVILEFDVQIYSSRSGQEGGINAMQYWLMHHLALELDETIMTEIMDAIGWPTEKPPAMLTIDDRAITFTGIWPTMDTLRNFKPWNKQ